MKFKDPENVVDVDAKFRHLKSAIEQYTWVESLNGLKAAVNLDEKMTGEHFFKKTLPFIIEAAVALPELLPCEKGYPMLKQDENRKVDIDRETVLSLMANMFLCTFDTSKMHDEHELNSYTFAVLFNQSYPQEVAKLRMFLNYFDRARNAGRSGSVISSSFRGNITLIRQVKNAQSMEKWYKANDKPLLEIIVKDTGKGFETTEGTVEADFANMFIGGGVLSGGCVQEEIRFSISPENCIACLLCPCMGPEEAIQIYGAEQFSKYNGYAFGLTYGGDFNDTIHRRKDDGTVLVGINAMDALDFRNGKDSWHDNSMSAQLDENCLRRELNKAEAAFDATQISEKDTEFQALNKKVVTGNWGSGAFGGCVHLKAVLQWASASKVGKKMDYYPFNLPFGPELREFTTACIKQEMTVGDLVSALTTMSKKASHPRFESRLSQPKEFYNILLDEMGKGLKVRK